MPSHHLILCHPLLLLPPFFPSIRVFSSESVLCITWPKYWSFSFSISPSNEYSGLIFFRMDWLDLPTVQLTLKSLLQHHSSKASILRCSAFLMVQLSHSYMTSGKTHFCHMIFLVTTYHVTISSVQFSRSVMSNSLRPHEWQHARPPCPSPTPRVHSDSHPYMTSGKTSSFD